MRFDILTIFPELFSSHLQTSLLGKAGGSGLIETQVHDLRDFTDDAHRTVDDTPYGGGAGMVMKVEPIDKALETIQTPSTSPLSGGESGLSAALSDIDPLQNSLSDDQNQPVQKKKPSASPDKGRVGGVSRVVVLSARGEQFTQAKAAEYAQLDQLILICGRYEGIDQRVADFLADEEISIGPYVLNGGEVAALVVMEAVARLLPGVVGNPESLREESFSLPSDSPSGERGDIKEYPHYTKPAEYKGWKVPEVLLSGNHAEIEKWRRAQTQRRMES